MGRAVAEDEPALPGEALAIQGSYWGTMDFSWDIQRWLGIAVLGNVDEDLATSRYDIRGGSELRLPRLFHDRGGIAVGYEQYTGWVEGQTVYAQVIARPFEPVLFLGRVSFAREVFDVREPGALSNEVGAYANVDARLAQWLHVRGSLLLRTPVSIQGLPTDAQPAGVVVGLHLAGVF
jgi:hypothetical protein